MSVKKMMLLAVLPVLFAATSASAQSVYYRSVSFDCASWYMCALYAGCDSAADRVVGGGTQTAGWQWQVTTVQSLPAAPTAWFGQLANTSPNTVRITVHAACLAGPTAASKGAPGVKLKPLPAPRVEPIS
jgi:hypothetical protein